jgi:hypothetical protein
MVDVMTGITNAENGVYILWGIALLGLMLKMISNAYIKMFMRKTENMATTKKKKLRIMRQKYENRKSMGMEGSSGDFVEKNVRGFRFMGVPLDAWGRHMNIGVYAAVIVTAGAFLLYDPSWRGSPMMVTFLANSVIVCAFLMSLENIFLTRTKLEIMKANIRDYLDNMSARCKKQGLGSNRIRDEAEMYVSEAAASEMYATESDVGGEISSAPPSSQKMRASDEISLDGFLKEFFS